MGQSNGNGAGISPAPVLLSTHILTHNTAIHNGQNGMFADRKVVNSPVFSIAALRI